MQDLIDKTNKMAATAGEPTSDFFKLLDKNLDGVIDREESNGFFEMMSGAASKGGTPMAVPGYLPSATRDPAGVAALMFAGLDQNKDGALSREEVQQHDCRAHLPLCRGYACCSDRYGARSGRCEWCSKRRQRRQR
jgi:hypothetical protein